MPQLDWPLTMIRETLTEIPEYPLPVEHTLRWYQPGDEAQWVSIQAAADRFNEITARLFVEQFQATHAHLEDRQCYLLNSAGEAVGTATAWVDDLNGDPAVGRVHWVALVPAAQGRGLAKPLMTAICRRLPALGHRSAYLTTSMARTATIGLYLKFGLRLLCSKWRSSMQPGVSLPNSRRRENRAGIRLCNRGGRCDLCVESRR